MIQSISPSITHLSIHPSTKQRQDPERQLTIRIIFWVGPDELHASCGNFREVAVACRDDDGKTRSSGGKQRATSVTSINNNNNEEL